ncbi:BglG family transcription antiterminator [Gracilinema caldarium]|uniref:PTS modulated transcriptional regulator, MtlR family n=1 Tax=Gracilinema caldarium (strain ATCC 51460 / DSM 7334 / H1) TaxID=744872 RepID=F8F340_GRAC1|nr:BglG family transcription antiterminator [Gracilinema caldarium]AEJ20366.1 PTS modulated transcriptional regulator, MtlR family [Gracilinema caldarium DSM 7334]
MNLTLRQRNILQILIDEPSEVTLAHIAQKIKVSIRTVHRELVSLSRNLERDYGIRLQARPGLGLKLAGDAEGITRCRNDLQESVPSDTSPEERQRMLCLLLLESNEAIKLSALAEELYSSIQVIRRDLDTLQSWFSLYGFQLTLRKGMGLRLEGSENRKREALVMLLWDLFGESGLLALLRSEAALSRLCLEEAELLALRIIPLQYIRYAEHVLSGLSRELLPDMAPQDYLQLLLVLAVAAVRRKSGYMLPVVTQELKQVSDEEVCRIARAALTAMFSHFSIPVDDAEQEAIERFLRGAHQERLGKTLLADNLQVLPEITLLIQKCEETLGQGLSEDRILRDGLLAHWVPALYRLQHNLPIKNPLLHRIKEEYGSLFEILSHIVHELFPSLRVPDDEVGYLVLHFGAALSRRTQERRRYRALVVCSAGIGSANMLASRLREKIPEIELIVNVSWFDIQTMSLEGWDILISTIPLPIPQGSYVLVEPLLSDEGVKLIRNYLNAKDKIKQREHPEHSRTAPVVTPIPASCQADTVHLPKETIFDHIFVFTSCSYGKDWNEVLQQLIYACKGLGCINDEEAAFAALAQRSTDHGILLPDNRSLFLHARSTAVTRPCFTIHRLREPLVVDAVQWSSAPRTILLMLAPQNLNDRDLSLLNEISVSLLDTTILEYLEQETEQHIRSFYKRF